MNRKLTILWLDDQRDPNTYFKVKKPQSAVWVRNNDFYQNKIFNKYNVNFIWVKSFEEFVNYIENNGVPKFISFDNDLKNGRMTVDGAVPNGEDCVKWLINYCNDNGLKLPKYYLHTANHKQRDVLNKLLKENIKMEKIKLDENKIRKIVAETIKSVLSEQLTSNVVFDPDEDEYVNTSPNTGDITYSELVEEIILNDGMGKCFKNRQALIEFCQYYFNEDESGNVECLLSTDEVGEYWEERYYQRP